MAELLHYNHHNNDNDYDYEIDDYGKQYHGGNEHHNYYNNIDDVEADVEVENNYIILANNLIKIIRFFILLFV